MHLLVLSKNVDDADEVDGALLYAYDALLAELIYRNVTLAHQARVGVLAFIGRYEILRGAMQGRVVIILALLCA